jgi:hypothetical protein
VKRVVAAMVMALGAWMGLSREAQAQALVTPTGPLAVRTRPAAMASISTGTASDSDKVYPGRTMGGGSRILRINPPPSSLKRREE